MSEIRFQAERVKMRTMLWLLERSERKLDEAKSQYMDGPDAGSEHEAELLAGVNVMSRLSLTIGFIAGLVVALIMAGFFWLLDVVPGVVTTMLLVVYGLWVVFFSVRWLSGRWKKWRGNDDG